ncbi:hypothetical protein CPB85DRAFT_1342218 [Mucidula mucida]|nr:hypothetical protein CPB85DRAFT_1342218 [Mucidula mucida]
MGSVPPKSVSALKRVLNSERTVWEQHHRLLKESLMPINYFHQPRAGQENRVNRLLQVQRRLATPPILASEAPLTSRLVPSGFYQNDYNFLSTLVISLLEMHGGIVDHPLNWPSPAKMISRVIMDECQLPQYTWQDFFDRVDLASMCTLHAEHSPDSESFCASYLWSHYMWCNSNDGLPRSTDFRIERTGVFTFPEILPSIQARIDTTILAQFPASDTTILVQFPASDVHTRVITSVLDHLLSSDPKTRLAEEVSTCDTCSTLFTDALRNMRAILSKRSLSLEDSTAFKDVIHRILSSDLFADRADHHKNDSLWRIRERTLFTLGFMRPNSNQPGRGPLPHLHRWPISEDVINSLIRLGLHPNSVDCMSNSLKLSSLVVSRIISEHWCISDVDTTYSTFLEVDAFAFLGATKFLFSNNISIVAAYVQGLLRAKDNMTFVGPYAEYLYHSPNLYTALLIVTGQFGSVQATRDVVTSLLTRIIKLCPLGPEEAQARWKTALASLEAFSNMIDPIEYEFFDFDSERMIVYTPAQIADIKLHVKCYRDFLAGHIERLQSNSLELIDAVRLQIPYSIVFARCTLFRSMFHFMWHIKNGAD